MKRLIQLAMLLALSVAGYAQTLGSIEVDSPSDGYHITSNTSTVQMTAQCYDTTGATMTCPALTWATNNANFFTVNSSGLVTGAGGPTGTFAAALAYTSTVIGHHDIWIDASGPATPLSFRPSETALNWTITQGSVVQAGVTDTTNNQFGYPVNYCAWATSNGAVATVNNATGLITAVGPGTANITCTFDGATAVGNITVTNPTVTNNTYYVRSDGGTPYTSRETGGRCNGTANAPDPGSGTNQNCAVSNPLYCWNDGSGGLNGGVAGPTDTCIVVPSTAGSYTITSPYGAGSAVMTIPSGVPGHPTRFLGSNFASCTNAENAPGNASQMVLNNSFSVFDNRDVQNVDVECVDIRMWADCTGTITGGPTDFPCPDAGTNHAHFAFFADDFTANFTINHSRIHGFGANWIGTQGPGLVISNSSFQGGALTGLNFDTAFGEQGNRSNGFTASNFQGSWSGCTEEIPKPVSAVSRSGGNVTITFTAGAIVNYMPGNNNITLAGMTPSDLNGTFPVTAVTFNQQSQTITGGSCSAGSSYMTCTVNTSGTPAFVQGAYVNISGATPSALNGNWQVSTTASNSFTFYATIGLYQALSTVTTISAGGTAATSLSVTATAAGSTETASTVGTAGHVNSFHQCQDQGTGSAANGDIFGTGDDTVGAWRCDHCTLHNGFQDGFDMLHASMTDTKFTNSIVYSLEGQTSKMGNMDTGTLENDVLIANCAWAFANSPDDPPDYNQYFAMPCRANDALAITSHAWTQFNFSNNTIDSAQQTIWDDNCFDNLVCGSLPMASFIAQNNTYLAFQDHITNGSGQYPGIYVTGSSPRQAAWSQNNNNSYLGTSPPGGGSGNSWTLGTCPVTLCIPDIANIAAEINTYTWNMNIYSGSASNGAGLHNAFTPTLDLAGNARPNPPAIGAYELGSVPPTVLVIFTGNIVFKGQVVIQ